MYYHDTRLQYPVRVSTPDPLFARQLQQAIGGIEGEIRVCLQYFFQAWGARGPSNKCSARHAMTAVRSASKWARLNRLRNSRCYPPDRAGGRSPLQCDAGRIIAATRDARCCEGALNALPAFSRNRAQVSESSYDPCLGLVRWTPRLGQ
jgi:hypothetical protein